MAAITEREPNPQAGAATLASGTTTASSPLPTLNIIGAGRLGATLGSLWVRHGVFTLQDVHNRHPASTTTAIAFMGSGQGVDTLDALRPADVTLLAVPDDAIAAVASQFADTFANSHPIPPASPSDVAPETATGRLVFHCSGALSADVLAPLARLGLRTASAHPLATFADGATLREHFAGTWCALEGESRAVHQLKIAFEAIGAHTVILDSAAKTLYHAAAVCASNYLVTLMDVSQRLLGNAGIERAQAAVLLEPLARSALDNAFRLGTDAALTGPIKREDHGIVKAHHAALNVLGPEWGQLYRDLAHFTAELAGVKNPLDKV